MLCAIKCRITPRHLNSFRLLSQAGSPRTPRSPKAQRMEDSPSRDIFGKPPVAPVNAEPTLNSSPAHAPLSGVDGDIKQAFGDRSAGRNLRDDLLMAADNVTSAMSSLVKELNSEDEDDGVNDRSYLSNGKTNDTDLDALEQQVNQIRQSLESQEERAKTGLSNGDITMTGPSEKVISHGPSRNGKNPKGRRAGSDTDTDDDDTLKRRGDNKSSSRTQMTDDESYIQTDDDEGTLRTDDEDMEWQEAIKRWVNR